MASNYGPLTANAILQRLGDSITRPPLAFATATLLTPECELSTNTDRQDAERVVHTWLQSLSCAAGATLNSIPAPAYPATALSLARALSEPPAPLAATTSLGASQEPAPSPLPRQLSPKIKTSSRHY